MPKKFLILIGALLAIIVFVWIGVSLYSAQFDVDINPNAEQHLTPIQDEFDDQVVANLEQRLKILKVSPTVFHQLEYRNNPQPEEGGDDEENN